MTTSTLVTMELAMWRMAASGEQALHFQPSTDEMAQLEEKHVEVQRYECTCYQTGDLGVCLQKYESVELKPTCLDCYTNRRVQLARCTDTQFHPRTIAHRNPTHPAFRGQTRFYEF